MKLAITATIDIASDEALTADKLLAMLKALPPPPPHPFNGAVRIFAGEGLFDELFLAVKEWNGHPLNAPILLLKSEWILRNCAIGTNARGEACFFMGPKLEDMQGL